MMTQSELSIKINEVANTINIRGSGNYIITSKKWYDYFNNTKSEMRMEKINRILKCIKEKS